MHPMIFHEFPRKESISDGRSVYDFLGGAIDASYKNGWEKNVLPAGTRVKPGYPSPSEWTVDWIACLLAAKFAGDRFAVIELGAGYGQWMVTSIMAYKTLHPEKPVHGMALEAETTHYEWLQRHVLENITPYDNVNTDLIYAAAGYDGVVNFPCLDDPRKDYGATYATKAETSAMREVESLSMQSIDERFGEEAIDLLHVDIQGAEADLISGPGFSSTLEKTRFVMFGTHLSDDLHKEVKKSIESSGMQILIEWPQNSLQETTFGTIQTNDGVLLASSKEIYATALTFLKSN